MTLWQAVWYILAIVLLILAAANIKARRVSLALLGAAFALLAYAWPGLAALT
jgi:hypothetical protein